MSQAVKSSTAQKQWDALAQTLRNLGVDVVTLPQVQHSPDMVFTANAGVVDGNVFIPSHFRFPQRQNETPAFIRFFKKKGYRIADVARGLFFEGEGDLLGYRDLLFGGFRYRSEAAAHEKVGALLGKRVITLELAKPHFYHLDTCFCPIDDQTALYYPDAFDSYGQKAIQRFIQNPIAVGKADAHRFACNAFRIGRHIVLNQASRGMKKTLLQLGYETMETPTSEFIKAGGSVKCLLLKL